MLKKMLLGIVPLLLTAASFTQQPGMRGDAKPSSSKVQRLNRAPVSNEVLTVKLPRPVEVTLPNGLILLVLEQHRLPMVNFSMWVKTGALDDPKDMPGLASFTANLLREGTVRRSSTQIATELDELGATFLANAPFGEDVTNIYASGLSPSADKLLELVSDIVLNPSFPTEELEKYRRREKASLTQIRSQPRFLAQERFASAVYGDFAAAVQAPTADSLDRVTPDLLKDFRAKHYAPNNTILAVGGDITPVQATALVKKYFGDWRKHEVSQSKAGQVPGPAKTRIYLVDRAESVQANIVAGGLSLRRIDPDFIPLTLANRILGGGPAGRLFTNLREEKGYTYGAYSRFSSYSFPGTFQVNTEVRNVVVDGSLHELIYELKRLRDEKVPEAELNEAKRSIVASFALSLENLQGQLNLWLTVKYYALPANYWDEYPEKVARLDADAVQRVARKYIDLDHLQVVVVGDAKQIKAAVEKYGAVDVFNVEGKPAPAAGKAPSAPGSE